MRLTLLHFANLFTLILPLSSAQTTKGSPAYNGVAYANFKAHEKSYLNITSVATELVHGVTSCAFACVETKSCFSFNLARNKTSLRLCELLQSDRYINSDKFNENHSHYDHYAIPSPCSSGPCLNNGTCVPVYQTDSFTCLCAEGYTGINCENEEENIQDIRFIGEVGDYAENGDNCSCSSGLHRTQLCNIEYRLVFREPRSTVNYVMKQPAIGSDLSQLSVCFFVKIVQDGKEHSVISYAKQTTNDFIIGLLPEATRLYINTRVRTLSFRANSTWHHFCFTWENTNGIYKGYKDGKLEDQGADFEKDYILKAGGIVVLGQDQDSSVGDGFNINDAFAGELTGLNMWDRVLSADDIAAQYENCSIPHGSVIAWPFFKDAVHGQVQVVEP